MFRWTGIAVACLLLWPTPGEAQNVEGNLWFVRGGITPGFILSPNPFGVEANGTSDPLGMAPNMTIEVGRRTDGTSAWHDLYGTPSYGFGFSFVPLPNGGGNSQPLEAYTFFSWPFVRLSDRF